MEMMIFAMLVGMALLMVGGMVLVMVVLHRKPRGKSTHDARGTQAE